MRYPTVMLLSSCLLAATTSAAAEPVLDCSRRSLASAVERAHDRHLEITFTGTCRGPIVIQLDGLTLRGVGNAVIDGVGHDAVTVAGASGVVLTGIEVRGGRNGVVGVNGAHLSLSDLNVHDNTGFGITLQTGSSAVLSDVTIADNGVNGLDLQTGSAATVTGTLTVTGNDVFGINVNGSALTLSRATVTASGNALGIQIATGGNAFISDRMSTINVTNNFSTGLTIVSGAHVERSIIGPSAFVDHDAHVTESIIFPGVHIGAGARLHRCIIDKNVIIPDWYRIGLKPERDRDMFSVSDEGVVVIEKDRRLNT